MVKRKDLGDVTMGGTKPEESDSDEVRLEPPDCVPSDC